MALALAGEPRVRIVVAALGLAAFLAEACRSNGYYQSDEYFQTIEFASFKLGRTPAGELPWEFRERMRPFLQPAAYVLVVRALEAVGIRSPASAMLAFRLASAVLNASALILLWAALATRLPDARSRTLLLGSCLLTWYLPFLGVRTSSESVSGALLAAGVAAFLLARRAPVLGGTLAGLAMGLAFEARYQVAFAVVGFAGWALLVRRSLRPLLAGAMGFALALALGAILDRWGYGAWTLTPWNYLRVNLVEGRAAGMGTEPFHYYAVALAATRPPLPALFLVALVLYWIKAPRDPLTWTMVPFALAHGALAHKELRFLFPLGPLAAAAVAMLWLDPALQVGWWARVRGRLRPAVAVVVAVNLAYLLALQVMPVRYDLTAQAALRQVADERPGARFFVLGDDPFHDSDADRTLVFLRPWSWSPVVLPSWDALPGALGPGQGRSWVIGRLEEGPPTAFRGRHRLRLVAAAVPEWAATWAATPFARRRLRGLWEINP